MGFGNASFRYVDIDVANFDPNGISSKKDQKWAIIEKEEDARWFKEHVSTRFSAFCNDAINAISVYHTLYQIKWIGNIVNILLKVSRWLKPKQPKVKQEIIENKK